MWAEALGDFGGAAGAGGSPGFNVSSTGMAAGLDARLTPNWVAGTAFGYAENWLSSNGLQSSGTMDDYNVALYSGLTLNHAYVRGALGYSGGGGTLSRLLDLAGTSRAVFKKRNKTRLRAIGIRFNSY